MGKCVLFAWLCLTLPNVGIFLAKTAPRHIVLSTCFSPLTCGVFVFSSVSAFLRLPSGAPLGALPKGSDVRPGGVPGSPPLLRGRGGSWCSAKGSDVRPGVPLVSLGLRLFCVAGVGQCALPRGRMYALASLAGVGQCALPRGRMYAMGSASFAWQAWDNVHCQGV